MSDRPPPSIRRLVQLRAEERVDVVRTEIRKSGRYTIRGKITEGAVGEILLAHDESIGRDLVLKLLRSDHMADAESVRRFVEEAQVAGQLQHPGVVPIYELGLHQDRPFFAMRLVKGKTLAAMLAERREPGEKRQEFLSIFLQMCEPIAYAHARGVIHCDLKPANVLVGSFGEVQVVDWGFARVLARGGTADERLARQESTIVRLRQEGAGPRSTDGATMGTPQYMSPEQALGQIGALDARTDVFALGAVLCELLTGSPPYAGDNDAALADAAKARLDPALERLDACGRAEDLVDLARRCLEPERAKRPRDATQVARGIAQHLVDIDNRERHAKLAAVSARQSVAQERALRAKAEAALAKARTRQVEEKTRAERDEARAEAATFRAEQMVRARKRILVIAGCALIAALGGLLGYASILSGADRRVEQAQGDVHALLVEAEQLKGAGEWTAGAAVVARARDRAGEAAVSASLQERIDVLASEIDAARAAEEADAARVRKYRALVRRLADARLLRGSGATEQDQVRAFVAAFRAAGLPVAVPADAGEFREPIEAADREHRILTGAMKAPPARDLERTSATDAALAGLGLIRAGAHGKARAWLERAYYRHAADRWVTFYLALALTLQEQPRHYEARSYLQAVAVHYPDSEPLRRTRERVFQGSDLDGLRAQLGWEDASRWLEVKLRRSVVTGTARRIRVQKVALTQALLAHRGGAHWEAAKLEFPEGAVFVAEDLDDQGKPVVTRVLIARKGRDPDFRAFDVKGIEVPLVGATIGGVRAVHLVPATCRGCHAGKNYYQPMQSFPREPEPWRVELGPDYRGMDAVLRFFESFHRGGGVFGPYGAMWINKLRADAKAGRLTEADRAHYEKLAAKYPELMAVK